MTITSDDISKIGLGGSCHWCTEAIFDCLSGVVKVEQGWLCSVVPDERLSEGVIVSFDMRQISLEILIEIHLHTHSCTVNHSMRAKYRSAIYYFNQRQLTQSQQALNDFQCQFEQPIITQILPFACFKSSPPHYQKYYVSDPQKPFCKNIIDPKLNIIRQRFAKYYCGADGSI